MQYIIHVDVLSKAARDFSTIEPLFEICQEKGASLWATAFHAGALLSSIQQREDAELQKANLNRALEQLNLLNLTVHEMSQCMVHPSNNINSCVSITANQAYNLDGIIAVNVGLFKNCPAQACTVQTLIETLTVAGGRSRHVPLLNIGASYPETLADIENEMADVIRSGHFILGGKVKEMESQVAGYCETPHAVGVSSGTDALIISLMAAGVGPGDEVITTPFTFFATVGAIARVGATPVFVDIEPNSFNIDPALIEERITPKTKAILPVHLYGQCANMDAINKVASQHKLTLIEDAAQAIGSKYQNRPAGSLGDFGCFSFFPTKNLGGFGDGGLVTVKDEALYKQLSILRVHGAEPKYYHQVVGGNFRIDALQAAVVSAKLKYLDGWIRRRQENAARYTSMIRKAGLSERIDTPACVEPGHSYNQYVVRIPKDRDAMRTFLGERGVASEIYYPVPLHLQECFASLGYKKGDFPHAEDAADQVLALPISHEVTEQQQTHVVNMMKAFYQ